MVAEIDSLMEITAVGTKNPYQVCFIAKYFVLIYLYHRIPIFLVFSCVKNQLLNNDVQINY
jgi:hypothetical protein